MESGFTSMEPGFAFVEWVAPLVDGPAILVEGGLALRGLLLVTIGSLGATIQLASTPVGFSSPAPQRVRITSSSPTGIVRDPPGERAARAVLARLPQVPNPLAALLSL